MSLQCWKLISNRTVGVDSKGMYEAILKVYKALPLANELKNGSRD